MWPMIGAATLSALGNYFGGQSHAPSAPPAPSNYFGADGAMQVWNPYSNGYFSLGARTSADQLGTNWQDRLLQNKLIGVGGYGSTQSQMQQEIQNLQGQWNANLPLQARDEISRRISDLQTTMAGMKDYQLDYSPIGMTSASDKMRYQGQTDTANQFLTQTLDKGYDNATAAAAQANASRGMAQSTMADWGQNKMASQYALDKTNVAMQADQYYQGLKNSDENAKLGILNAAQSGLGMNASINQGQQSASNAQANLAQQMASYNTQLQSSWQTAHDRWSNQQAALPWQSLAGGGAMAATGYGAQQAGYNPLLAMFGGGLYKKDPNSGYTGFSQVGNGTNSYSGGDK